VRQRALNWPSDAKELLKKDIEEGRVTEVMTAREVYEMHPAEFKIYKFQNFANNLKSLRALALLPPKETKAPDWKDSDAKELLKKDIEEGRVTEVMMAREVYAMHPEFDIYKFQNFANNLKSLRALVKRNKESAAFDSAALANDQGNHPRPAMTAAGLPRWYESDAERLLKVDVNQLQHETMTPQALHESRPEHQVFSLHIFRQHIQQESRSRKEKNYWLNARKNKNKNKNN
jgi:hypothetical protein